jgi:hypothetical protein
MTDTDEHIDSLVRHIQLVREACVILGKRLIKSGRVDFGIILISRGHEHDVSKFKGIEWRYLHRKDSDPAKVKEAISQHTSVNQHHPEYWGGIDYMPEIAIAEMVCDWYARSQEGATDLRIWIETKAIPKYKIKPNSPVHTMIDYFVSLLAPALFTQKLEVSDDA